MGRAASGRGSRSCGGADRRRHAALHVGHDRPAEGRDAHQRQPRHAPASRGAVVAVRRELGEPRVHAALPHRRLGLGAGRHGRRRSHDPLPRVRAGRDPGHAGAPPDHQCALRPGDAAVPDDGARCPGARLSRAAVHRVRRRAHHQRGARPLAADLPLPIHPGLRAHRDHRRHHTATRRRPRGGRPARAPAALGRQAVPPRRAAHRRAGPDAVRARRGRRGVDPLGAELQGLLGASTRRPRARSTPTAGCAPATPATSTRRATCSSPTG